MCGYIHYVLFVILLLATSAFSNRYALIIGQNNGGTRVKKLRYAESDAKRCRTLMSTIGSFPIQQNTLLLHPDSIEIIRKIHTISDVIEKDRNNDNCLFLLYYSGHADQSGLLLDSTHFSFKALKKAIDDMSAGMKIAIFDACQSGTIVSSYKGGTRATPFELDQLPKTKGEIWIASSSANELAQESDAFKSSLFSFHFFNGLCGSADKSGDRRVSLNEGYQYAYKKTIETSTLTSGIVQHPVYRFNITGEGDIILSDLRTNNGGIVVTKKCSGSFLIMSQDYEEIYADFKKGIQKELFIALSPGSYTIINAQNNSTVGMLSFTISKSSIVNCKPDSFKPSLIGQMTVKGNHNSSDSTENAHKNSNVITIILSAMVACLAVIVAIKL